MQPIKRKVVRPGGAEKWEVDFGIVNGHRKRPLVDTEKEADALVDKFNKDLKKAGEFWAHMDESDRLTVTGILLQMAETKTSLGTVWEEWKKFKRETNSTAVTPTAYEDAVDEFKKRKLSAGKSQRYVDETAQLLVKFGQGRERQNIHEIAPAALENWLAEKAKEREWSVSSKKTNQSLFSSLWDVAIDKGWASLNICDRLEQIKRPGQRVEIYPNETVMNIMAGAMEND